MGGWKSYSPFGSFFPPAPVEVAAQIGDDGDGEDQGGGDPEGTCIGG